MKYPTLQSSPKAKYSFIIAIGIANLGGCATPQSEYHPPPASAGRAIIYAERPEFPSSNENVAILEIDRLDSKYSYSLDVWQEFDAPESINLKHTIPWAVSPGNHKLLIGACRANYIPFCDNKCAKVVLRLKASAGGLYRIRTDIDDDKAKFRIVDVHNRDVVAGPVRVESHCSISSFP